MDIINFAACSPQANHTEWSPLVGEVSAILEVDECQLNGSPRTQIFIQIAPQLFFRVDPVSRPLFLRISGSAGNRTPDLCICSQEL
jgi:hypothetical protein